MKTIKKIVLAYSGGLDTSVIIPWLKENYTNCEVIAVVGDVGQGPDELDGIEAKALKSGATKVYVKDLKREFVEDYLIPAVQMGATYEGKYLLGTALARPCIAKALVKVAQAEGADAIAHGCTGKGNDQVRFELSIKALDPAMEVIAPWRLWDLKSRDDEIDYAKSHQVPLKVTRETNYSKDKNIWHLSHEGLDLEDPANEPQYDKILEMSVTPEKAPDVPVSLTLDFVQGNPVALNGQKAEALDILEALNKIGGENGVGIIDIVENRLVGMKSRGVYETPGGTILYYTHGLLESLCMERELMHYKAKLAHDFAELVYNGKWESDLTQAMLGFLRESQKYITGEVGLKIYKGNLTPTTLKSPYTLYSEQLASFGEDNAYSHKDAAGFINLYGLPLKVKATNRKGKVA